MLLIMTYSLTFFSLFFWEKKLKRKENHEGFLKYFESGSIYSIKIYCSDPMRKKVRIVNLSWNY